MNKVLKIEERCDNAWYCAAKKRCPANAIEYDKSKGITIDLNKCVGCGVCVRSCPKSALKLADD